MNTEQLIKDVEEYVEENFCGNDVLSMTVLDFPQHFGDLLKTPSGVEMAERQFKKVLDGLAVEIKLDKAFDISIYDDTEELIEQVLRIAGQLEAEKDIGNAYYLREAMENLNGLWSAVNTMTAAIKEKKG